MRVLQVKRCKLSGYKCLLDVHGVLGDFVGFAVGVLGIEDPYRKTENYGRYDAIAEAGGDRLLTLMRDRTFWRDIPKTPWADELVAYAQKTFGSEQVAVCSAPALADGCLEGVRDWVRMHYPFLSPKLIQTQAKAFCAHERAVLIDDKPKNVQQFNQHGGTGVTFPQLWNHFGAELLHDNTLARHALAKPLDWVKFRLNMLGPVDSRALDYPGTRKPDLDDISPFNWEAAKTGRLPGGKPN